MVFFVQVNFGTAVMIPHGNKGPGCMLGPNVRGHTSIMYIQMMLGENSLSDTPSGCRLGTSYRRTG